MAQNKRQRALVDAVINPVRLLPLIFLVGILIGAVLLMLPVSHQDDVESVVAPAFFTSVSAVTVTGLASVDTATHWTPFGQGVIVLLVQVGGFGIMTLATMLGLVVGGRLGLRTRLIAQAETHVLNLGEVSGMLRRVAVMMLSFELVIAAILTVRYRMEYFDSLGTSLWHGVFHAVMSFNNAGFALESDSLVAYVGDAWLILPICFGVFVGALGFPVMAELFREWRTPDRWTIHTRLTVWGSIGLLVLGVLAFLVAEWHNAGTIGGMHGSDKLMAGVAGGVMPRSGGFNSIDYGSITPESMVITDILMFIGGGSASTAGGIKVTTFLLLAYVILAEVRGDDDVEIGNRRIESRTLRQAVTIALLSVMLVVTMTLIILAITDFSFDDVLFEVISAFATVGLSTGLTPDLPVNAQVALMVLMFIGRVGTVTVASALALRGKPRRFHLPEEKPIIG